MAPPPSWWLTRLSQRLDYVRPKIGVLRRYLEGDAPLPEGAEGCRDAYKQFQRKARTNFAELVTGAVADRMIVTGFRVGDSEEDDDEARRLWKANRLNVWSSDVHWDMLGLRAGYVMVQTGPRGNVEITRERPEQVITDHDPNRPDHVRAGLKVYRDDVAGRDFAFVHSLDDNGHGFVTVATRLIPVRDDGLREPIQTIAGGWQIDDETATPTGLHTIPIVPFVNRWYRSEFETHIDILDRINWVILQRLVITAMQAYRQRATKGDLPETDEANNPIDYGELFKPGPGALWQLPEGVDLWESAQTELTSILESVKADIRDLAAVTRTPMSMFVPDGQNQTAEGAAFAREGLVWKSEDRIARASVWSEVMRIALALERGSEDDVPEVEAQWASPERRSLAERYDALAKAGDNVPWRSRMTHILGFDGDTVDRMEAERAEELLLAASFAEPSPGEVAQVGPDVDEL